MLVIKKKERKKNNRIFVGKAWRKHQLLEAPPMLHCNNPDNCLPISEFHQQACQTCFSEQILYVFMKILIFYFSFIVLHSAWPGWQESSSSKIGKKQTNNNKQANKEKAAENVYSSASWHLQVSSICEGASPPRSEAPSQWVRVILSPSEKLTC